MASRGIRLCRAQGISPDTFQSHRDTAKMQRSWFAVSEPLAEVVGKRGLRKGVPTLP